MRASQERQEPSTISPAQPRALATTTRCAHTSQRAEQGSASVAYDQRGQLTASCRPSAHTARAVEGAPRVHRKPAAGAGAPRQRKARGASLHYARPVASARLFTGGPRARTARLPRRWPAACGELAACVRHCGASLLACAGAQPAASARRASGAASRAPQAAGRATTGWNKVQRRRARRLSGDRRLPAGALGSQLCSTVTDGWRLLPRSGAGLTPTLFYFSQRFVTELCCAGHLSFG